MIATTARHPTLDRLRAFGQGRLNPADSTAVEEHVATCNRCCEILSGVQGDSLVRLAREAAALDPDEGITRSFAPEDGTVPLVDFTPVAGVPLVLQDHPRYKVLERVGAGGMGVVFKAQHRFMDRIVALKVINPTLMANPNAVSRFRREVRAAAKLNHPSIVTAFDADQAGDLHFLVMEFIDGISLARFVEKKGPMPVGQACHFVRQAALGLQHAHQQGMVHRDIKPQNLMVNRRGQVKLLDLGLARLIDSNDDDEPATPVSARSHASVGSTLADAIRARVGLSARGTATSVVLGTPDYLAPEQAEDSRSVDIRADLYSLGCTLYFMLSGRVPFPEGNIFERLVQHKLDDPTPIESLRPDVPGEVVDIVKKLMAKKPGDRFQTPVDLATALAQFATLQPESIALDRDDASDSKRSDTLTSGAADTFPSNSRPGSPTRTRRVVRRRSAGNDLRPVFKWIAAAIAFQILLIAVGVTRSYLRRQKADVPETTSSPVSSGEVEPNLPPPPDRSAKPNVPPTRPKPSFTPERPATPSTPIPDASRNIHRSRVLFLLPQRGLWMPDYLPVRRRLEEGGCTVKAAATCMTPCRSEPSGSGPPQAQPDFLLDEHLTADQFDAVVFVGKDVREFFDDSATAQRVRALIAESFEKHKIVAAICVGQAVLKKHGFLEGHTVARNLQMTQGNNYGSTQTVDRPVVVEGNLITGRGPDDAAAFADAVLVALKNCVTDSR